MALPTTVLTIIYAPELATLDSSFTLVLPGPNTQPYTDDCSGGKVNTYVGKIKQPYRTEHNKDLEAHPVYKVKLLHGEKSQVCAVKLFMMAV